MLFQDFCNNCENTALSGNFLQRMKKRKKETSVKKGLNESIEYANKRIIFDSKSMCLEILVQVNNRNVLESLLFYF